MEKENLVVRSLISLPKEIRRALMALRLQDEKLFYAALKHQVRLNNAIKSGNKKLVKEIINQDMQNFELFIQEADEIFEAEKIRTKIKSI